MFLRQLNFRVLSVLQLFYVHCKEKTPFFFNLQFLLFLSERGLSAESCLAIRFAICSKSIPGFSISRLANVEDSFNVNIFLKCKYVRTNDYSFKYVCVVCCLKIRFYCLTFSAISNLNSADFTTPNQSSEILILKIEMLLEFQNKRNSEIIGF